MSIAIAAALALLDARTLDYDVAKARALILSYHNQWEAKYANYDVIDVESEFRFPLLNPETETASRTFDEAGKIDGVLQHRVTRRFVVLEHKTTADAIDASSDYWDKLSMDTQTSKYILALRSRGLETGNLLHDVLHKPGSRPRQIPKLDDDGYKIVLDAEGKRIYNTTPKANPKPRESADPEKGWVLQSDIETPAQYGARLTAEIAADPNRYFAQREVPRLDTDLLEYMGDAWALSQEILMRRRMKVWPRNPGECTKFGKCEFYDLCTGRATVDGIRFRPSVKHRELEMEEGDRELLTNSRQTALRNCARLHYHRYEQPIEPVAEESEALRFGALIHEALEAYFTALKTNQPPTQSQLL
jgi:hypothetical protein